MNKEKNMIATALSIQEETKNAIEFPMIPMLAKFIVEHKDELDSDQLMELLFNLVQLTASTTSGFISHLLLGENDFHQMVDEMVEWKALSDSILDGTTPDESDTDEKGESDDSTND